MFDGNFRFLKNQIFFQKITIFKIKNLQDEKIFFVQIFFCIKVCISTIQKTDLEHPGMCLEAGAAVWCPISEKQQKLANFAFPSLKNEVESCFGVSAQPANYFCSEEGCFNFGLNAFWCCANSSERSGQLFFYSLKNLRNCKFCCSKTFPISLMMSSHAEMPIFWCSAEV